MKRIDWLLYNRAAGWQVRNSWVDWTVPVPTHAAQWLELPLGERAPQPVWVGAVIPDPAAPVSRKAARRLHEGLRGVRSAVCARRLDEAWERFDAVVTRWHAAAAETANGERSHGNVQWQVPEARLGTEDPDAPVQLRALRRRLAFLQLAFAADAHAQPEAAQRHLRH